MVAAKNSRHKWNPGTVDLDGKIKNLAMLLVCSRHGLPGGTQTHEEFYTAGNHVLNNTFQRIPVDRAIFEGGNERNARAAQFLM